MSSSQTQIRLARHDAEAPWAQNLRAEAQDGLRRAEARLGLEVGAPVTFVTLPDERSFHQYLGARPTHVIAVTRAEAGEIVILRPVYVALSDGDRRRVLAHEAAHAILGRRVAGPLPAWLNEGLAMLAAGQGSYGDAWRVSMAATMGTLLPLRALDLRVASGDGAQELAYAQSLSVTRFFLARGWPQVSRGGRDPLPLAQALADPVEGARLRARLWDPDWRDTLEFQWRASLSNLWTWLAALSGTGVLWGAISILFLVAYWRKRRMTKFKRRKMEERESLETPQEALIGDWDPDENDE